MLISTFVAPIASLCSVMLRGCSVPREWSLRYRRGSRKRHFLHESDHYPMPMCLPEQALPSVSAPERQRLNSIRRV
jgi:hypothetical protein